MYGKRVWFFPDGDRPPAGDSPMKGHESFVILNPNEQEAHIQLTLYFEEEGPVRNITMTVKGERVKCFQTHNREHFGQHTLPVSKQYAVKIESDVPIIAQYGRLDARQENLAYYTSMGYPGV
jgi:hypothetical protein